MGVVVRLAALDPTCDVAAARVALDRPLWCEQLPEILADSLAHLCSELVRVAGEVGEPVVRRVLTDNARNYTVARVFLAVADANGLTLKLTRPYRPQTNGKAERFIQTLRYEWAYARPYRSNAERLHQLPRWLYRYNARRLHGGIGGVAPASRL